MRIPVKLSTHHERQKEFDGRFIHYDNLEGWYQTAPHSMRECVRNNSDIFSEEETDTIYALLDSDDLGNRMIAFEIISSKPEKDGKI